MIGNSLLGAGSRVSGEVHGSVLGADVVVHRGAGVRNSVLFDGVVVRAGARIDRRSWTRTCRSAPGRWSGPTSAAAGPETPTSCWSARAAGSAGVSRSVGAPGWSPAPPPDLSPARSACHPLAIGRLTSIVTSDPGLGSSWMRHRWRQSVRQPDEDSADAEGLVRVHPRKADPGRWAPVECLRPGREAAALWVPLWRCD